MSVDILIAVGTVMTACFTGISMWIVMRQNMIRVIALPNGGFKVHNPANHTIVVRKIIAKGSTLGYFCATAESKGRAIFTDSGSTELCVNKVIEAEEEKAFSDGVCINGFRFHVIGKAKRVKLFCSDQFDIVLRPGEKLKKIGEE